MAKKVSPSPLVLNEEQRTVVDAGEGVWRILAGPGSGKSACLIARYNRLVREGVSPNDILSLTFSKGAAKSLREKAEAGIGIQKMDRVAGFVTFHSLALSFCTEERDNFTFKLSDFVLATEPQANKFAFDAARKFEINPKVLRLWMSLQIRRRIRPAEAVKIAEKEGNCEKLALAYKLYSSKLRNEGVLDFDWMLLEMVELLSKRPDVLERWQYRWLMIDEAQDCDELQHDLITLLSHKHGNAVFVGDPGQNLYSFRGSSSQLFMDMPARFPGCRTLFLAKNHRSTPQVVEWCRQVGPVPELAEKFYTENPVGPEPVIFGFPSAVDEANAIAQRVQKMDGVAILCRTNRGLRPFEDALSVLGVRYYLQGKSGFWSQSEVKNVLAYLQCTQSPHDGSVMTAFRSSFWPTKYLRRKEISDKIKAQQKGDPNKPSAMRLLSEYRSSDEHQTKGVSGFVNFIHMLRRYRDTPATAALTSLLGDLKAFDSFTEEDIPDNSPTENIQELVKISKRFQTTREFLDYARRVSAASKNKKGVCLSTCHSAKGLEWNTVFLVAVQAGMLPHAKAESIEDEKNVLFVGISRAKRELHISYSGTPSPFLKPFLDKPEESLDNLFAEVNDE